MGALPPRLIDLCGRRILRRDKQHEVLCPKPTSSQAKQSNSIRTRIRIPIRGGNNATLLSTRGEWGMKFGTVLVVKKRTTKKTLQLAGRRLALTDFAAASF